MNTLLIASGAYCDPALAAEFGQLPPSMLPLGGRRLYEWQVADFKGHYDRILLSVPKSFVLDPADERWLESAGVSVVWVADQLSLGHSISAVLSAWAVQGRIDILYGDTLVSCMPVERTNYLATGVIEYSYNWYYPKNASRPSEALCGFLSFSDATLLVRQIDEAQGHFINAIDAYAEEIPLELHLTTSWLDLGHIHTYFHSRAQRTTERAFNTLTVADGVVTKRSKHSSKLCGESRWFSALPDALKVFAPQHLGEISNADGEFSGYRIEYLPLPSLADLLVFGRLPTGTWRDVFSQCEAFLEASRTVSKENFDVRAQSRQLFMEKTMDRIGQYEQTHHLREDQTWRINGHALPSLRMMAEACCKILDGYETVPALTHGDFCCSNILYESRLKRIKLIDPRGVDYDGHVSVLGDQRYEMAKLAHSLWGSYDFIVAGRATLHRNGRAGEDMTLRIFDDDAASLRRLFLETPFCGRTPSQWGCLPAAVLLFLSMLPLHEDSPLRQSMLLANAMRLFTEIDQ